MSEMVTLILTEMDAEYVLVECPAENIRAGMVVEADGRVGIVKQAMWICKGSRPYNFALAMGFQDEPYQAERVYAQCWERGQE